MFLFNNRLYLFLYRTHVKIEKEAGVIFGFDDTKNKFSSVRSQAQPKKKRKGVFSFFASLFKRK